MSKFDRVSASRLIMQATFAGSVAMLSACSSVPLFKELKENLPNVFEQKPDSNLAPREFITKSDVAKVKVGMSTVEVRELLGTPMLNDSDQDDHWDYVLKQGQGAGEEFLPYTVYLKDAKVSGLSPLESPPDDLAHDPNASATPSVRKSLPAAAPSVLRTVQDPSMLQDHSGNSSADVNIAAGVNEMISGWVHAWSSKDFKGYLSYYSDNFEAEGGSRKAWEKTRRKRIVQPAAIKVDVSNIEVNVKSDVLAEVTFIQKYSSKNYTDTGKKTLTLTKASGKWKIQKEDFEQR